MSFVRLTSNGIRASTLSNGVGVVTERIDGVRSAAVGVWVGQGSAHESPGQIGISHLLEHHVFKGTERRDAREIALALESLGGSLDAYTGREHTSFQARVLDEHVPTALEVLGDLVVRPLLESDDLEMEREVVLEEISQVEDTPDDLVFELHGDRFWRGHPYGRPILGSRETVSGFSAEDMRELHRTRYTGANMLIVGAGHLDHDAFLEAAAKEFEGMTPGVASEEVAPVEGTASGHDKVERETAQAHLVFGRETVPHADPRRYALSLLSHAFGGGMSSRIFQRVREELGLAYAVYSYQSFYSGSGIAGVYVGTRPEWSGRAEEAIRGEYARVADEGLSISDLGQIKSQVKGQIMLALESTSSRLYRLASFLLHDEPYETLDESLARIDAVTIADVQAVAKEFYDPGDLFALELGP
jgi:predicted Zn-dependent peptidase